MNSGGLTGGIYKPLNPEQVEVIQAEALRLLEEVGMTYTACRLPGGPDGNADFFPASVDRRDGGSGPG